MHHLDKEQSVLMDAVVDYAKTRIAMDPPPLDGPRSEEYLKALYGASITKDGLAGEEILRRFVEGFAPATLST